MPNARPSYGDLPVPIRDAITAAIGPIDTVSPVDTGPGVAMTALAHTRKGRFFVKAVPAGHDASRQLREAGLAPYLLPIGAALIAHLQRDWDILIFEALNGRPANYAPGSEDLPAVAELLTRVARVPCPSTVDLYEAPLRLQQLINDPDLSYFAGSTLLHTDLAPANVIIIDGKARLVGWAAATRGAAWLDPAFWVIRLIAAGHPPAAAEDIVARIPAWQHAPATAVSLFATAQARIPRRSPVGETLRAATRRWLEYRRSLPT
ncbi:hypothetical protein [Actinoplanes sp. NPDC051411]|uniref:hypothetical protein n=1 Tax=Actinoplanes sp. NPDC051411 TaxID=3155522 RepID=UPI0034134E2E